MSEDARPEPKEQTAKLDNLGEILTLMLLRDPLRDPETRMMTHRGGVADPRTELY